MIKCGICIIRLHLLGSILWFCTVNILSQTTTQISIPIEVYDDAGGQKTLYFGLNQKATDGIDNKLYESELPPYPPTSVFEARWVLPENNFNGSLSPSNDYRFALEFPYSGTKEHRVRYQISEGATVLYFGRNLPSEVTGLSQDIINGVYVNVAISGNGVYDLTDFIVYNQLKLLIYYNNIVPGLKDETDGFSIYTLEQNFPNPFNPSTTIKFSLPETTDVSLTIYNTLGQKVGELVKTNLEAGWYSYQWDATNIATGIYI
jgi:hypothetical protein